jgi:hypothetical protein
MTQRKMWVGVALAAVFGFASEPAMPASNYVQAPVAGGVVIVSILSGKITFCPGIVNGFSGAPIGVCTAIGQISTTNLAGNLQINAGTLAYDTAFVTNIATGTYVQCGILTNAASGVPFGGCSTHEAP